MDWTRPTHRQIVTEELSTSVKVHVSLAYLCGSVRVRVQVCVSMCVFVHMCVGMFLSLFFACDCFYHACLGTRVSRFLSFSLSLSQSLSLSLSQ